MFGNKQRIKELEQENGQLNQRLLELGALDHIQLEQQLSQLRERHSALHAEIEAEQQHLAALQKEIVLTSDIQILQEVGVYHYRHPLETSAQYKEHLEQIKAQIKAMVQTKTAVHADANFSFNNSAAKGRTFTNDFAKLMLRAYNAEAENCVRVLKAGTLPSAEKRLNKTAEAVARLGRMMDIYISREYHSLRLKELSLTADYLAKLLEEKEAARAERERLREEEKARQEYRREQERLEKERSHYANALAVLRAKGELAEAEELEKKLVDLDEALEGILQRAANIRAGYVYVISNIGAFGERMVKIGMTRRLNPLDRVQELGDASVPFRYDIHALFFSDDAVGIEARLHRELEDRRVNRVNLRREFFYVTPSEVKELLLNRAGNLLEYVEDPEASEYHQSIGSSRHSDSEPTTMDSPVAAAT